MPTQKYEGYYLTNPTWQAKTLIDCKNLIDSVLNSHFDDNTIKKLEKTMSILNRLIEDSQDEEW